MRGFRKEKKRKEKAFEGHVIICQETELPTYVIDQDYTETRSCILAKDKNFRMRRRLKSFEFYDCIIMEMRD